MRKAWGFSAARLARIAPWYQARFDSFSPSDGLLPGAVVAIAKGGKLAYLQAIGFQDRAKTVPMKTNSIFWIASMSKPVASVAAMILVDEGKLDLDAPVSQYLPELANMRVAFQKADPATGEMEYGLGLPKPAKRAMTVRDLLRHTVRPDGAYYQWRKDPPRELSIDLVADERFGRAIGRIEAS
ncbi:beta-lactamase family protein [Bradyrhizobium barranii subsp. barranii]|uniref:Beta-lactamase family protein n=1 Tax=Bradyrhizobium barranii subsp. barranii TaxID=2823807 RepID=A0A9X9YYM5_9BRAD|nr:serine hydrolase domain-containing protein [Bradyrhizobium barranii]UGX96030.1 beta-lactamase family protein [Bradyrhizobium barranii subsp. barranii]